MGIEAKFKKVDHMTIEEILYPIQDELEAVEEVLQENGSASKVPLLSQVGNHILSGGGKRFRPALTLLCARLCETSTTQSIPLAASIELIHNATLLHDDIIDKSSVRRGKPAAHILWGDRAGVLTANIQLSQAFSLILNAGDVACLQIVTRTLDAIVEGELLQLFRVGLTEIDESLYQEIILHKTAYLISTACHVGALPGKKTELTESLVSFGRDLGMAFQIIDDLLDYTAREEFLGKQIGSDFFEGKLTLPLIITLARCNISERNTLIQVLKASREERKTRLSWVTKLIDKYDGFGYTFQTARNHITKATEAISAFPNNSQRQALEQIAQFVLKRTH